MNTRRQILFRLQLFFRRRTIEAELTEELRIHLEMSTAANIAAGMSPEQARYAAHREFGGVDQAKEAWRDERGLPWLEDILRDVRHSARSLLRDKGFTATVLLILRPLSRSQCSDLRSRQSGHPAAIAVSQSRPARHRLRQLSQGRRGERGRVGPPLF
jgi:hypothetical protein